MILVVGSTGQLGGMITRRLIRDGHQVRAVVRNPQAFEDLKAIGAEPVFADLKDKQSLITACAGTDTVITTAIARPDGGTVDNVQTVDLAGNANLIDAARQSGVRRCEFISAYGASPDHPVPFLAAKGLTEQRLRDSGMNWTIIAPDAFMEVWLGMVVAGPAAEGREVVYVGSGRRNHSFVSVEDVADLAVAAIQQPEGERRYLAIGGPRAFSLHDTVEVLEHHLGRPVRERGVEPGIPIEGMPEFIVGLLTMLDTYDSLVPSTEIAAEFALKMTTVEEWAARTLPVAVPA